MPRTPDFNKNNFDDLLGGWKRPRPLPETGWNNVGPSEDHGVDFQGTWSNVSDTTVPASWYLSEDGEVRLRGRVIES